MKISPKTTMKFFKYWPPFLSCGISVKEFDLDKGYVVSQLKQSRWNTNAYGTLYGGSLFSMCDPFYVFILAHKLGRDYYIWDFGASIKFVKSTKDLVTSRFEISEKEIEDIKSKASGGEKVIPVFETKILDSGGKVIAEVTKTLYVKKKPKKIRLISGN